MPTAKRGPWQITKFSVTKEQAKAHWFRSAMSGQGERAVDAGHYTKLEHEQRGVIMSDTPAEIRDHWEIYHKATGHVLINGLGLGVIAVACLKKPEVDKVTIIEIDPDVIALVGPHLKKQFGKRVEIIQESAFDYQPPKGIRYGAVWHDIWDAICLDNWEEYKKLHRKYGRRTDWQGSWGRYYLKRQLRESYRSSYYW